MKKSQVFAALALAFALGVVAPVAGVYAQLDSSVIVPEQTDEIEAAEKEVEALAATAVGLTPYKSLCGILEGDDGYIAKLADAAEDAVKTFKDTYATRLNNNIRLALADTAAAFAENLKDGKTAYSPEAINVISNTDDLETLYNELNSLKTVVTRNKQYLNERNDVTGDNTSKVVDGLYLAIINDAVDAMNAIKTDLASAGFASWNWTTFTGYLKSIDKEGFDELNKKVGADTLDNWALAINFAVSLPKYSLGCAVADAEETYNDMKSTASTSGLYNYNAAMGAISAYKNAIIAFKNGVATTPGNNGNGDNKDEDDKKPTVGDNGILTTAEGTAAASAGIMAAVATALTAAGVGVVAFRNARRK